MFTVNLKEVVRLKSFKRYFVTFSHECKDFAVIAFVSIPFRYWQSQFFHFVVAEAQCPLDNLTVERSDIQFP